MRLITFILSSAIALTSIPVCASAANDTSRRAVVSAASCPDCGPDSRAVGITVVALAPDGTWGVATEPDTTRAIVNAIRNCKAKYKSEIGCSYQQFYMPPCVRVLSVDPQGDVVARDVAEPAY